MRCASIVAETMKTRPPAVTSGTPNSDYKRNKCKRVSKIMKRTERISDTEDGKRRKLAPSIEADMSRTKRSRLGCPSESGSNRLREIKGQNNIIFGQS
ncbi:hypothetical protein PUN28_016557 [Cardiocondyla obscurior]|uniref:Uncharacterized protein n=1 Tax=Cardiocondyla obscurior TaxID=286306 RepID=A0AAW2EPE0_9HYME